MILLPATRPDPTQVKIHTIDSKMNQILNDKSLSKYQKMQKYFEALRESMEFERKFNANHTSAVDNQTSPDQSIKKEAASALLDVDEESIEDNVSDTELKPDRSNFERASDYIKKSLISPTQTDQKTSSGSPNKQKKSTEERQHPTQRKIVYKDLPRIQSEVNLNNILSTNRNGGYSQKK